MIDLTGINGRYQQYPFHSLNGQLILSGVDPIQVVTSEHLAIDNINAGVLIHNFLIRATAIRKSGQNGTIKVQQAQASLLGGEVKALPGMIDLNQAANRVVINLHNIDMEQLVKLEQKQGLRSTGRINGKLPLLISKQGISMTDGHISALPPYGVIQYRGNEHTSALAKNNANLDMLLMALQNFHYHRLEGDLIYRHDGQLHTSLSISGKNPEFRGGQMFTLNIKLEDNIPKMLRSLLFTDEISRQIEKGIQRHQ